MDPRDLIKAGRLAEARAILLDQVRGAPSDTRPRTILFQLLAYLGEWQKSLQHLEAIAALNPQGAPGIQVYRDLIAAELERNDVLAFRTPPSFLSQAPEYVNEWIGAGKLMAEGNTGEAAAVFEDISDRLPTVIGTMDGIEFSGFQDADSFLSPFLELFVHGRYVWAPVASLREISISAPMTLLDLLWIPAQLMTWEGLASNCFMPVLYQGTSGSGNDQIRLGNMTDWHDLGNGVCRGIGQHLFFAGDNEKGLLELREITFTASSRMESI